MCLKFRSTRFPRINVHFYFITVDIAWFYLFSLFFYFKMYITSTLIVNIYCKDCYLLYIWKRLLIIWVFQQVATSNSGALIFAASIRRSLPNLCQDTNWPVLHWNALTHAYSFRGEDTFCDGCGSGASRIETTVNRIVIRFSLAILGKC